MKIRGTTITTPIARHAVTTDSVVSRNPWSSKNTVDKLCPSFTETGSAVVCNPVEGYPLNIVSEIEPIQEGSGDASPDNVRPISGHSSVKLWRGGKNILDTKNPKVLHNNPVRQYLDYTLTNTGFRATFLSDTNNCWAKLYYIVGTPAELAGKTITVSAKYQASVSSEKHIPWILFAATDIEPCNDNNNIIYGSGGYMPSEGYVSLVGWDSEKQSSTYMVTGNEAYKYIIIALSVAYGGDFATGDWAEYSDIHVEIGDTATEYEPYRGEEITIDLGQEVYGGSLDWNSGVLTIDRAIHTLDGTEVWEDAHTGTSGAGTDSRKRYMLQVSKNPFLKSATFATSYFAVDSKLLCSKLPTVTAENTWYSVDGISSLYATNTNCLYAYCEAYATDFQGFKEMMKGAQIVFGLKEPITIQLTPQEIRALSGTNTIYSDTGETTVNSKADPVTIIENLLARLTAIEVAVVNNA